MSIQTAVDVCARRFPPQIHRIQNRFAQANMLLELPVRALRLLHLIVSYTPLSDAGGTIIFSREKAAGILHVSTRSISRYLTDLVHARLLERLPQKQKNGVWDCTSVRWTHHALEKFFAPGQKNETASHTENSFDYRGTDLSHKSKIKNKEDNKAHSAKPDKVNTPKTKMPGTPADLIETALSLKLDRIHVATLMKNCKQTGQRLQNVFMLYAKDLLSRKIMGKQALAWLLAVIRKGQDTGWLLAQRKQEVRANYKKAKIDRLIEKIKQKLADKPTLPDGSCITEVHAHMLYLRRPDGIEASSPVEILARNLLQHHPFWIIRLLRGKLVLSSNHCVQASCHKIKETAKKYLASLKVMLAGRKTETIKYA